jgi:hypothetical protein
MAVDENAVVRGRDEAVRRALALEAAGDDGGAIAAWSEAESHQWTIGTWSTGSGEGLASMGCVYELMLRRATCEERLAARALGTEADAHRRAAQELLAKIAADPNGVGERVLGDRWLGAEHDVKLPPMARPRWPR